MKDMMLIVDDLEINRDILKIIFEKEYEILETASGTEALMMLEGCQDSINVILLDLNMPVMSGFELLEKRKELEYLQKIPVVVITSSEQMEDQVKAFELGANEYISKPFVPEIVLSRVNNVMSSYRRMLTVELKAQKMKLKSELDEMTGLCNKTTTELSIDGILKDNQGKLEVILVIDIDNFKAVNDISGHQVGDHVIKIIANLISSMFRKTDIVGRIGGDEFCVLMVDVPNMDIVYSKVEELIQIMRYKPNMTIPEYVTLSIGMATNKSESTSYHELFVKADSALYEAKHSGKAQYREFGVEPLDEKEDERPTAILLSNNRSVCTAVNALMPTYLRIIEVLRYEDLEQIDEKDKEKIVVIYIDISDTKDDAAEYWKQIKSFNWIDMNKVFAICEEGNMSKYLCALNNGITDMLTTPIDSGAFKRRTIKHLEKYGINKK